MPHQYWHPGHKLLNNLDESVRSGYRVAKYLIQNDVYDGSRFYDVFGDKELHLFGYEPLLKSSMLRLFFWHLLTETFDMPIFEELDGGSCQTFLLTLEANTLSL